MLTTAGPTRWTSAVKSGSPVTIGADGVDAGGGAIDLDCAAASGDSPCVERKKILARTSASNKKVSGWIVARSIEKIYGQNAQNIGLLTSTDFALVPRLAAGEEISRDEFVKGLDPISTEVVRVGGLFEYSKARLAGTARSGAAPVGESASLRTASASDPRGSLRSVFAHRT
jgi:hypothetical protein